MKDFRLQGGNRETMSGAELEILDTNILPTARRWLREFPGLAEHAISTMQYWREPLVDGHGNAYRTEDRT